MALLTFDLETLPVNDPAVIADIRASKKEALDEAMEAVKAPSNYKDEAKIAEYIRNKQDELLAGFEREVEASIAKTSFDGAYGRICCIGYAFDDQAPVNLTSADEATIIRAFFDACIGAARVEHYGRPVDTHTIVGHNVSAFDLRFLWQRAVIHGIPRPSCIPWKAKPWDSAVQDTMTLWNPDRDKRISLDRLCKALGVPTSKNGLDGSMIAQAWANGRFDEIATYCMGDVVATRECYRRMTA